MRKALDRLYDLSGGLAALFLCAILLIVLAQVSLNIADKILGAFAGSAVGLVIPSYAEFAGYFLAAATFLAMAYALRGGAHIRVNLVITNLGEGGRRVVELFSTALGFLFCAYITYFTALLVYESFHFGDVSPGMIPVKVWIPQLPVFIGFVVLTISFLDFFILVLRGARPEYMDHEDEVEQASELAHAVHADADDLQMLDDDTVDGPGEEDTTDNNADQEGK